MARLIKIDPTFEELKQHRCPVCSVELARVETEPWASLRLPSSVVAICTNDHEMYGFSWVKGPRIEATA